jgi:tetratricopeptide (TPR) repeat protein
VVTAAELVDQGIQHGQERNSALALLDAHRVRAMVQTRQGRWEDAQHSLEDAIALAQHTGDPYAEARAVYHYGELYRHQGEPEEARPRFEAALAIFRRLGARPYIERTEHILAGLD